MSKSRKGIPGILGVQQRLSVLPEEDPLPSEVVLDGGVLSTRRREALANLRAALVDRPADVDPEDWRVVVATLAPPYAHLPRAPGTPAKSLGVLAMARECYPHMSPTAALRAFREAQQRPAVKSLLADLRALEVADILEQRGMIREALHATIRRGSTALYQLDPEVMPNEWAKVSACVTAACKVLADMDALALRADEIAAVPGGNDDPDDGGESGTPAALAARVAAVAEDMKRRKAMAGAD